MSRLWHRPSTKAIWVCTCGHRRNTLIHAVSVRNVIELGENAARLVVSLPHETVFNSQLLCLNA